MFRFALVRIAVAVVLTSITASAFAQTAQSAIRLFNGKDLAGWKTFLAPDRDAKPEDVWTVKDGAIICTGKPNGYLRTAKEYGNYVLRLEWRWPEGDLKGRNSGVFVHVTGPDKIWPKGIEAQLMAGRAGDFWLVDGYNLIVDQARKDPKVERHYFRTVDNIEKPFGEWNQYEITCKGHQVDVKINGQLVNQGAEAESDRGAIVLQSEGAEIHFRNVTLTPLD